MIHYLVVGGLFTACHQSTFNLEPEFMTTKKEDTTCPKCKQTLSGSHKSN